MLQFPLFAGILSSNGGDGRLCSCGEKIDRKQVMSGLIGKQQHHEDEIAPVPSSHY